MKGKLSMDAITRKIGRFNVRFRYVLIAVFSALCVLAAIAIPTTKVLYDVAEFLPDESTAATGLAVLKKEFDDKGNAYAVVKEITEERATLLAKELQSVKGVATTVFDPSSSYKSETSSAMITILFTDHDSTKEAFATMDRLIDATKGYDVAFIGQSASSYYTKISTEVSIFKIGVAIVIVILVMLVVTSKSFFELVPMLLTLGVSALLNMGTNFLFGGISYISNLVSLVLQLALSIDYSVILLHRYVEERDGGLSAQDAAVEAQRKGFPEILASSLTTIAGMCALILMKLDIGVEIGLALTKGILLSLISVLFLMPALLVLLAKPLEKGRHRSFIPSVVKPTRKIVHARKIIVPVFLAIVIFAGVGQSFNTYAFDMNNTEYLIKGRKATEEAGFGKVNPLVLVVPNDGDDQRQREVASYVESFAVVDSATAIAAIEIADGVYLSDRVSKESMSGFIGALSGGEDASTYASFGPMIFNGYCSSHGLDPAVAEVPIYELLAYLYESPNFSKILPSEYKEQLGQLVYAKNNLVGENYVRMTFNINAGVEDEAALALIKALKSGLKEYYDEFYMTGETVVCYDMAGYFPMDNLRVNLFTLAFILLILLFTFRNLLLPVILTLTIEGGIWLNCVLPFLTGSSVCFIGYLIICAIQMGATIDYAIVLTNRYRSIREKYIDRFDAMAEALNAVFPTVITSGIILTLTGFILSIASSGVVAAMGTQLGFGALFAVLIVLFILPSFLLVTEKVTDKCGFKNIKNAIKKRKSESGKE
ncbi:MAG: MMPL family transporter [Clostridia bacterium]|nr:MMPL family transporter [Clostridia bacterium]